MSFVNIHVHNHFSGYDGFGTPEQHVRQAVKLGQTALGSTNHGNVSGLVEHKKACEAEGINPVMGVEAYFVPKFEGKHESRFHMLLIAMNKQGWHNLMSAISEANRDKFYRYPLMDFETLERYNEGLIMTTGCLSGIIPRLIAADKPNRAKKMVKRLHKIFGDRLYLEVMPYDVGEQKKINKWLVKAGKELGIQVVMTADSHYMSERDYDTYQMMFNLSKAKAMADYSELHMPSEKEVLVAWKKLMGDFGNPRKYAATSQELADRCKADLDFGDQLPQIDWGMSSKKKLRELAIQGLKDLGFAKNKKYKEQLREEIGVIEELGFSDYFLICWDIGEFCRQNGIRMGFGRGSVCGSLLAYLIGITETDSIEHGNIFERFLRVDKKSWPDIDMDIESERREEVIDYLMQKYLGRALPISTFGYYKSKNLINDLCKAMDVDADDRATLVEELEIMLDGRDDITVKELKENVNIRLAAADYPGLLKHFSKLFGQIRYTGKHPGGIVITADEVDPLVGAMRIKGEYQASFKMDGIEDLNLLKMDVLGVKNVTMLSDLEKASGVKFDVKEHLGDEEVMEQFRQGKTDGIFQFESRSARKILTDVSPDTFAHIVACVSLNRPATLALGMPGVYARSKEGDIDESIPWYDWIKDTYGTLIYQEQIMYIVHDFAGLSWAKADVIVKNISKKRVDSTLKQEFMDGVAKRGVSEEESSALWDNMTVYLFNKGHACGYSMLAYAEMWYKVHYPTEFWWALLKRESAEKKRDVYEANAVRDGHVIFLPHVNGTAEYAIANFDGEKIIQKGLTSIKGVGIKAAEAIAANGPYISIDDFENKVPRRGVNIRVREALLESGALEFSERKFLRRCRDYQIVRFQDNRKIYGYW